MTMQTTPPTSSYWVLLLGFVVVGIPFSVGVVTTVSAIQESADTQLTQGTVVAFEGGNSARGPVSKPVVEYHVAGQTYRFTGRVATNMPIHAVGDQVAVLYKPNEPGTAFIDSFFDRWLGPLLFTGVGFLFLVILVIATTKKIKGQRAAACFAAGRSRSTSRAAQAVDRG
ncbi:hypothetical protein AYO44_16030 [Planctomycetaceae bacterium SCGC AG-212-F19]|nr:hypothetical protein AYO44_16030 [Planctomycetaceae bacterium SCGC AG-212-F19]